MRLVFDGHQTTANRFQSILIEQMTAKTPEIAKEKRQEFLNALKEEHTITVSMTPTVESDEEFFEE